MLYEERKKADAAPPSRAMDPYLERRDHWHAVHTRLLVAIADALGPRVATLLCRHRITHVYRPLNIGITRGHPDDS